MRGRIVLAKVTACDKFFMRGKIVDRGPFSSLVEKYEKENKIVVPYTPAEPSIPSKMKNEASRINTSLLVSLYMHVMLSHGFVLPHIRVSRKKLA